MNSARTEAGDGAERDHEGRLREVVKIMDQDHMEKVCAEATEGPWSVGLRNGSDVVRGEDSGCVAVIPSLKGEGHGYVSARERLANAAFIATFDPPTVSSLLSERRRLVEALERIEAMPLAAAREVENISEAIAQTAKCRIIARTALQQGEG